MKEHESLRGAADLFDPARLFEKPEALRGVRVLELSTLILGPSTACFLAELGAEAIKVELPPGGDTMRAVTPEGFFWQNASLGFLPENHNKHHVAIDVHRPEGQELFKQLVARSDVVVENLRAGTMERKWGLGYRQLREVNPQLIYLACSGFGQWGPFSEGRASYDALAQAASGLASLTGFPDRPPLKINNYIGDWFGAVMASTAVLIALYHRRRTGEGQFIDYAQSEGLLRILDWTWIYAGLTGKGREKSGNRDLALCPSDIFRCADGFAGIAAARDEEFRGLCQGMGRPELVRDERFSSLPQRLQESNARALLSLIGEWAAVRPVAEIERLARQWGFAAARVASGADHYRDAHWRARQSVRQFDDELLGDVVEYGPPVKMSATPPRLKSTARPVGFDNDYVFTRVLGLSVDRLRELEQAGAIGRWADRPGAKPPDGWDGSGQFFAEAKEEEQRAEPLVGVGATADRS